MDQYQINVSREDFALIGAALAELPYKISAPLLGKLQAQINIAESNAAAAKDEAVRPLKKSAA